MSDLLTTEDVYIKPVAVEVKAIRIGKRQMTQAVFKQLVDEFPLDDKLNWKGTPWGTVRHCNQYCSDGEHRHVIWQKGNELRRCEITRMFNTRHVPAFVKEDGLDAIDKQYLLAYHAHKAFEAGDKNAGRYFSEASTIDSRQFCYLNITIKGKLQTYIFRAMLGVEHVFTKLMRRSFYVQSYGTTESSDEEYNELLEQLSALASYAEQGRAAEYFSSLADHNDHLIMKWKKRWDEAVALDQLFIAV